MPKALGFLARNELGLPLWAWGAVVGGGILVFVFGKKYLPGIFGGGTDQAASNSGSGQAALPSTIDPLTGVPYSIESAINPGTGLPAYYGTGMGTGSGVPPTPSPIPPVTIDYAAAWKAQGGTGTVPQWFIDLVNGKPGATIPPGVGPGVGGNPPPGGPPNPITGGGGTEPIFAGPVLAGPSTIAPSWPGGTTQQRLM